MWIEIKLLVVKEFEHFDNLTTKMKHFTRLLKLQTILV